jgi:hypothetical protein
VPAWAVYLIGVLILAAVAVVVFRSTVSGVSGGYAALGPTGPRAPADYFAEADRLADLGDRVGAIRALCAGVAATIAGERTWEGSPLTVREIFRRAPDAAGAARVAEPYRAPREKAA